MAGAGVLGVVGAEKVVDGTHNFCGQVNLVRFLMIEVFVVAGGHPINRKV